MVWCDRGVQMLLTTVGAFAAFSLMAIAIGTDYWLYSSAHICNGTNITTDEAQGPPRRARGDLTHSGLWRICCLEAFRLLIGVLESCHLVMPFECFSLSQSPQLDNAKYFKDIQKRQAYERFIRQNDYLFSKLHPVKFGISALIMIDGLAAICLNEQSLY
ncbi:hypothetical protein Q9966_006134 [Columba livia]|nr:hypothetical protein Q9966_006134 [Columba livia]